MVSSSMRGYAEAYVLLYQHKEAITHYELALALNPMFVLGWFGLGMMLRSLQLRTELIFGVGCASLEEKDFSKAINAFSRVVALEPEVCFLSAMIFGVNSSSQYGDAWNNLAAAHLQLRHAEEAFTALQEAVKLKRDSWKVWENYVHAALVLSSSISCLSRR